MAIATQFREVVAEVDNWFYRKPYAIEPDTLLSIQAFNFHVAASIWQEICGEVRAVTFRRFRANHWVQQAIATGSNWYEQWNTVKTPDPIAGFLTNRLVWDQNATVIVIMDNRYSYRLSWQVFLSNWMSFLFDEDGIIVTRPNQEQFVFFGDDGVFYVGKRPVLGTIDD